MPARRFVGHGGTDAWADGLAPLPPSVRAPATLTRHLRFGDEQAPRESLAWAETWVHLAPGLVEQVVARVRRSGVQGASNAARSRWPGRSTPGASPSWR